MTTCQSCSAPTDLYLCSQCVTELRTALTDLPQWLEWLTEAAVSDTRMGDSGGRGSTRREPFKGDDQALTLCRCGHPEHENIACRAPITETFRDDVGIFAAPSGISRTMIVGICKCDDYEPKVTRTKLRAQLLAEGRVNARASDRLDTIRDNLTTWVRHIAESRGIKFVPPGFIGPLRANRVRLDPSFPDASTTQLVAFLFSHAQAIACDESAGEIHRDITGHIRNIERIIDRPDPKIWLTCLAWNDGTRKECGHEIRCAEDTIEVTCKACRTVWNVNRLRLRMEQEAERKKLTIADILKMNRRMPEDRRISERTLRRWRRPGPKGEPPKLKPQGYRRPDGREVINRHSEDDEPLFRWADITRLRSEKPTVAAR